MKYNPETNRCRGVDPRLLGNMLGTDSPVNCNYGYSDSSRTCRRSISRSSRSRNSEIGCSDTCPDTSTNSSAPASSCGSTPSLAMVYSPLQHFVGIYSSDEAIERGTLFSELDKPWKAGCR